MVDFTGYRRGSVILPVSASDEREILRLPQNVAMQLNVSPRVPGKIPRWYRAGVQLLVEATGRWPNREIAHREIMFTAGYIDSFVINERGEYRATMQSTAGWDHVQWREFLDAALPVMLKFAGETRAQYRNRVDRFFGISLREAWES